MLVVFPKSDSIGRIFIDIRRILILFSEFESYLRCCTGYGLWVQIENSLLCIRSGQTWKRIPRVWNENIKSILAYMFAYGTFQARFKLLLGFTTFECLGLKSRWNWLNFFEFSPRWLTQLVETENPNWYNGGENFRYFKRKVVGFLCQFLSSHHQVAIRGTASWQTSILLVS